MLKHYKMTFTQDRETYKTYVVPAENLAEAYIIIQDRFPNAEITEAVEGNCINESWSKRIAKYLMANATFTDTCKFMDFLDADKREELIKAIWDERHRW